ncbi:UNVERIFIED_CONTAM: hypothetical protein K2H54_059983 [Gekko kuhli]
MASIKITPSSPECAGVTILGFSADALKEIASIIANVVDPIRNKIQQIEKSFHDAPEVDQDALKPTTEQFKASLRSVQKQPMESTVEMAEPRAKVGDKICEMEAEVVEPRKKRHESDRELAGIQEDGATYMIYYRDMLEKKDEDSTEIKTETLMELFEMEDEVSEILKL